MRLAPLRIPYLILALLAFAPGPARASREQPSNGIFRSVSGDVGVVAKITDFFEGNTAEFQRDHQEPGRLYLQQFDIYVDLDTPTTIDLKLRSITEPDHALSVKVKDLRAFILRFDYSDAHYFHRNEDQDGPRLERQEYKGDFYLRRFNDHPLHLFFDGIARRGPSSYAREGPFDFDRVGAMADLDVNFGRLVIEVPHFRFEDHLRKVNNVADTQYRIGFHRQNGDTFVSTTLTGQYGELPELHERYEIGDVNVNGQVLSLFGFHDVNSRLQLHYRYRPEEVTRNFHYKDYFVGDLTFSVTPIEKSSLMFGVDRKTVDTRRLNRPGIDLLDNGISAGKVPTIAQLESTRSIVENELTAVESYVKFYFNNWKKFSGHARLANTSLEHVPYTDVTAEGSAQLTPTQSLSQEYRLAFTPEPEFGVHVTHTQEERRLDERDILRDITDANGALLGRSVQGHGVRNIYSYSDFHVFWKIFRHLTTGAGISEYDSKTSQSVITSLLETMKSYTFDISWDFRRGLELFTELRENNNQGVRVVTEHIAESGIRYGNTDGIDGKFSVAFDHLIDTTLHANDYRFITLNMAATAHF